MSTNSVSDGSAAMEPDRGVGINGEVKAAPASISGVSPSIIPMKEFPKHRWLYTEDTLWYYHAPRNGEAPQIRNDDFEETVDPCLREFVEGLLGAGVQTMPSCQGHFYEEDHYRKIWQKMAAESEQIRSSGLVLRDDETAEDVLFRDESYQVPWESFEHFYAEAGEHQNAGFLGFVVEDVQLALALEEYPPDSSYTLLRAEGEKDGRWLFDIFVKTPDPETQCEEWARVQEHVLSLLRSPGSGGGS